MPLVYQAVKPRLSSSFYYATPRDTHHTLFPAFPSQGNKEVSGVNNTLEEFPSKIMFILAFHQLLITLCILISPFAAIVAFLPIVNHHSK